MATAGERAALPTLDRVYVNPAPAPIPDFTLTDQSGQPRKFSSLRGEPLLVFFGFPLRIRGGHGSPVRAVAMLDD